jgi:hypothetical protein
VACGTLVSAAILYPQYKKFWAVPPTATDILIYLVIIFGIGFLATQSLRRTFMLAFRMGSYPIQKISLPANKDKRHSKNVQKKPAHASSGQTLAVLELAIGVCSLGLSIFSVFFLGHA